MKCLLTTAGLIALVVAIVGGCARSTELPVPTPTPTMRPTVTVVAPTNTPSPTPSALPSPTATPTPTLTAMPTGTTAPTASPTNTESATATRQPVATATSVAGPSITYFRVKPELVDPGDAVTLTWASKDASKALLYKLFYSGQLPPEGIDVPPTGSYVYEISPQERNWVNFLLYVWDEADRHASAGVSVELRCPEVWFFEPPPEDICPTAPLVSSAAEQHFENGTMVWVAEEDAIFVFFDAPQTTTRWSRFQDHWEEGMADRDPDVTPPPGLQQPIRGFGLVWREQSHVREQLGWAVDDEQGFTTVMQRTTRYKYNAWYLLALDGDVWYLGPERSSWDKVPVTSLNVNLD